MMFVEDAVASLSVPWKWDILHRWKHGDWLRNRRHHPATAALLVDKSAAGEQQSFKLWFFFVFFLSPSLSLSFSFDDRMLLVYDRDLCTKEEDDPRDAIVFFHPVNMMLEQKCDLSCQLVGVVHFFNSCFDTPRAIELKKSKSPCECLTTTSSPAVCGLREFKIKHYQLAHVILGAPKSLANYVLQQQMDLVVRLLRFYHKGLADMNEACSSGEPFGERVREFFNACLPVCCGPKDQLSNLFQAVPTLNLPEAASNVYAKGYTHLEELQKMPGVLASCVTFDERVLASQFTPEMTQLLLLAATSKERLAMEDVPVKYFIPPAVRLVNVYLEASWLKDLAVINKQSNESPKELDKYVDHDDAAADDEKSLSRSTNLIQEQDACPNDDGTQRLPAAEDKEPERADSLSDVDSALSSQTTNHSSTCAPLASTILQVMGKRSLPDSDFLSDFDSAEDASDGAGPDACLRRLAELQYTVADCLRISQENLATDGRRRRRASTRNSRRNLRKYVSRPDLNRVLKDIDEVQGQEYASANTTPYRYDTDANVFQDYDAGMGFDAAGLFYQAQTMQTPTLISHFKSQRGKDTVATSTKEVATCQPHSQVLFVLYAKKFQRALTKFGEACSSLSLSKEVASGKKSLLGVLRKTCSRPSETKATTRPEQGVPSENTLNPFDLPPVVQVELGEALDVLVEESNKPLRKHKHDSGGSLGLNSMPEQEQPGSGNERVCSAEDVDRCTVLSDDDKRTDAGCSLPALAEQTQWHLQSIQHAHGEFLRSTCVNNMNALSLGNTWIQATRSEDHETFKVTIDDPKDLSPANVS
ncbi:hypothetical protein HPB52_012822 [Rhipicephalus sanguineus]|uniref:CCZ1/INTU/HSP4 first Longin domain-containing protein n=1 Tax=Rhipicephalus sanguineus TaxID=34632 RepID=A0A9D4SYW3_RHISA|nr:hypothetical protein HPB52_012822 [Rhipicephalus sanguineus]